MVKNQSFWSTVSTLLGLFLEKHFFNNLVSIQF
jgi:hypothetical protein